MVFSLKWNKKPLKIRLVINTQNSAVYKIGKSLPKELRQIKISGKSYIKDSKSFVENIKHEKLSDDEFWYYGHVSVITEI